MSELNRHQSEISNAIFGKWVLDALTSSTDPQSERVERAKKRLMTMKAKELIYDKILPALEEIRRLKDEH